VLHVCSLSCPALGLQRHPVLACRAAQKATFPAHPAAFHRHRDFAGLETRHPVSFCVPSRKSPPLVRASAHVVGSVDEMTVSGALHIGVRWVVRPENECAEPPRQLSWAWHSLLFPPNRV
ncbi:unnamed protein product, partial [Ectocarpus sp. 4 AP-2014]